MDEKANLFYNQKTSFPKETGIQGDFVPLAVSKGGAFGRVWGNAPTDSLPIKNNVLFVYDFDDTNECFQNRMKGKYRAYAENNTGINNCFGTVKVCG